MQCICKMHTHKMCAAVSPMLTNIDEGLRHSKVKTSADEEGWGLSR